MEQQSNLLKVTELESGGAGIPNGIDSQSKLFLKLNTVSVTSVMFLPGSSLSGSRCHWVSILGPTFMPS